MQGLNASLEQARSPKSGAGPASVSGDRCLHKLGYGIYK